MSNTQGLVLLERSDHEEQAPWTTTERRMRTGADLTPDDMKRIRSAAARDFEFPSDESAYL